MTVLANNGSVCGSSKPSFLPVIPQVQRSVLDILDIFLSVQVPVLCGGKRGFFLVGPQRVECVCAECWTKPESEREMSCTQFEAHCGAGAAKKWKASLRVEPGSVPEVPGGAQHSTNLAL
jgi:SAND domain